ncbi:hypothetical protein ACIRD3_30200 [Kitasatospora sp. NPDC093550]|uniref:hypothetical protein n=1 Tax=Kitasatospora sp. NPDC093550 TaxID=3364089 RepID=UPI0037F4B92F
MQQPRKPRVNGRIDAGCGPPAVGEGPGCALEDATAPRTMVADHVLVVVVLQVFHELRYLIDEADAR